MFSYISEGEPSEYGFLPAGVYEGKIVKMEEGISQGAKTRGCPQLAVHIRAFGPEGAATVRYYLTNSKDLAWKIDLFVKNVTGNVYQPGQQVIINPADVSRKGADTVAPEDVAKYATWIGVPKLLKSYGPLKADVFRALFAEALPEQQFPEELVRTGAGSSYVKKISVSKTATTK